jgi:hypothetical protein
MLKERVLAPLIGVALLVSIAAIAWSTKSHRRPGPLILTIVGALAVGCGRLLWSVPILLYGGSVALLSASFWNLWLKRRRPQPLVRVRLSGPRSNAP